MKTLNIVKIKNGTPQIIEAFSFLDNFSDSIYQEILDRAELRFCRHIIGPGSEIEDMDKTVYQRVVIAGYNQGVQVPYDKDSFYTLHLVWAKPS